jgi:hypothetical protein
MATVTARARRTEAGYDDDFYAWCLDQARALRRLAASHAALAEPLDLENLAEEIESLGRSLLRELGSRYRVLLLHLLKWRHQPALRTPSWRSTIRTQRCEIADLLEQSPSLRRRRAEQVAKAYAIARELAADETGLPIEAFPESCPFTLEQVEDPDFLP